MQCLPASVRMEGPARQSIQSASTLTLTRASSFSQYNPDLPMIQCDECKVWYHGPCIGCTDEDITDLSEVYFQCRKVTELRGVD